MANQDTRNIPPKPHHSASVRESIQILNEVKNSLTHATERLERVVMLQHCTTPCPPKPCPEPEQVVCDQQRQADVVRALNTWALQLGRSWDLIETSDGFWTVNLYDCAMHFTAQARTLAEATRTAFCSWQNSPSVPRGRCQVPDLTPPPACETPTPAPAGFPKPAGVDEERANQLAREQLGKWLATRGGRTWGEIADGPGWLITVKEKNFGRPRIAHGHSESWAVAVNKALAHFECFQPFEDD